MYEAMAQSLGTVQFSPPVCVCPALFSLFLLAFPNSQARYSIALQYPPSSFIVTTRELWSTMQLGFLRGDVIGEKTMAVMDMGTCVLE